METLEKTPSKKDLRIQSLMPDGIPRYVRCYDNGGKTFNRYTVVFTGRYTHKTNGGHMYIGMSTHPFDPQGFGQHGDTQYQPVDLPQDCQDLVIRDYKELWDLK